MKKEKIIMPGEIRQKVEKDETIDECYGVVLEMEGVIETLSCRGYVQYCRGVVRHCVGTIAYLHRTGTVEHLYGAILNADGVVEQAHFGSLIQTDSDIQTKRLRKSLKDRSAVLIDRSISYEPTCYTG